jgi:Icc protein
MRILQISDIHIVPEPGREIYGVDSHLALERVLAAALARSPSPDVVVATGDLSEDASVESYRRLKGLLDATGLPTYVIPGNHDSPKRIARHVVGGNVFREDAMIDRGWNLVFLDSRVRGAGHGEIGDDARATLIDALEKGEGRPALIALHHSPNSPCPHHSCQLVEGDAFLALVASYPEVRAVIAGHSHRAVEARHGDVRVFTTPSTCSQCIHAQPGEVPSHDDFWACHRFDPSRQGYRIIDLGRDGDFETEVHWIENPAQTPD